MREFVIRTALLVDFLLGVPLFCLLILVSPERYVRALQESPRSIKERILKYRRGEL